MRGRLPDALPLGALERFRDLIVMPAAAILRPKPNTYRLVAKSDGLHVIKWDGTDVGPLAGGGAIPTRTNYKDYVVANGATVNIPDADIATVGSAIVTFADGNNGGGLIQYFRAGTFNVVLGQMYGDGSFTAPRGSTFSAGTGFSFYMESNAVGARLTMKNSLGFGRTLRLWEWGAPGNITI